jgi:hypothetical protein
VTWLVSCGVDRVYHFGTATLHGRANIGFFHPIHGISMRGFTMEKPDDRESIHEAAREAIDKDELARVLELAADGEYGQDAAEALRENTADEIVANVLAATTHARRRGRLPTGEDIGDAADERRVCCCQPQPQSQYWEPAILKVER